MKKQVVIIHGGDSYSSYEEFVRSLKALQPEEDDFRKNSHNIRIWREDVEAKLAGTHDVFQPRMPNKDFARYSDWKIWFEKLLPFLNEGTIFIGHSLGGTFLAKYFAENGDVKKAGGVFFVAAPFGDSCPEYELADFKLPADLSNLSKLGSKVYLYASKDDKVVPFGDLAKYQKAIPGANVRVFEDRGHFKIETFPEILKDIESIK